MNVSVNTHTSDYFQSLCVCRYVAEFICCCFSPVTGEAEKEVDLEQYFQNALPLHCTTKFCDYGKAEGAKEYAELQVSFPHEPPSSVSYVKKKNK